MVHTSEINMTMKLFNNKKDIDSMNHLQVDTGAVMPSMDME